MTPQHHLPADIERTSMGIITAELAERLHMSEGGVRASLSRTRGRLKEYLLKEGIWV